MTEKNGQHFIHESRAARIVFGAGSLKFLTREIEVLGAQRAIVLCTPGQQATAAAVACSLGHRAAGIFDRAVMHVPIEVAMQARAFAKEVDADCAIAVGGGSTIGLGKAIALESGLPILAIPTTYAGSEMTTIYGMTEAGLKKTGRDSRVLPRTVLYDPDLLGTLPIGVAVTSGINAIAHAAEGLYAHDGNPIIHLMAEEGIRALASALPRIFNRAAVQAEARADALYGAWLCGTVLGSVAMGLHHKLCHTLGGSFNLPHAEIHTVMLAHTLAYNAAHVPIAMQKIARALGVVNAPQGIFALLCATGAPRSLKEIGMPESGLDRVAQLAVETPYPNPRPLDRAELRKLLQRAFEGSAPAVD